MNKVLALTAVILTGLVVARVQSDDVDMIAGVAAHVAAAAVAMLAVNAMMHRLRTPSASATNIRLAVAAVSICLLFIEVALRLSPGLGLGSYLELNGAGYRSHYQTPRSRVHTFLPGERLRVPKPEFVHVRTANALGIPDRDVAAEKLPGEFRILAMGDSFTEGVGAAEDATWVRVLERSLRREYPGRPIRAINAGVSGSDPIAAFDLFEQRLESLRPDLLILATNNSDLNEALVRGGFERFHADGTVHYRRGPLWEPVYALSYTWRLVAHNILKYNYLLLRPADMRRESDLAVDHLRSAIQSFQRKSVSSAMRVLIVAHPTVYEVRDGAYEREYARLIRLLETEPGLNFLNLLEEFAREGTITPQNSREFYWDIDLHHNERGYAVMGETIARHVVNARWPEGGPAR